MRKEVVSALNCEDFESFFSDYIDKTLNSWSVGHLQDHLSVCSACRETVAGMHQVRMALHNLGGTRSSAGFKLRLNNRLQEEVYRESWTWLRPVTWGFALAAAIAILLWPTSATLEAADSTMTFKEGP
ncbi:MAG TPA: zf-HC2 domain-containing protein, partial [Candidatus Latescibacteria bacterium]|nr:zf-HC2 domain-containing protein [Candidatus Latescibacterota bacterium]